MGSGRKAARVRQAALVLGGSWSHICSTMARGESSCKRAYAADLAVLPFPFHFAFHFAVA